MQLDNCITTRTSATYAHSHMSNESFLRFWYHHFAVPSYLDLHVIPNMPVLTVPTTCTSLEH
jgi:hypothetical protein